MELNKENIKKNQEDFNFAYSQWLKTKKKEHWDKIFLILVYVVKRKTLSMLKNKNYCIQDLEEKVYDVVCNIMRLYILKEKPPIKFLGSFVKGYILNVVFNGRYLKKEKKFLSIPDNLGYEDEKHYIEVQGKYFEKEKFIQAIRRTVLPTQIKKIIENRVEYDKKNVEQE